jgi:2-methylisocitrate lyase-like PEP mutase family enzyme
MLAARYGLPDLGLAALGEMVDGARDIAAATDLPFFMDGDDGYGDVKAVALMMQRYHSLGVGAVLLEDQAREGKQPGANKPSGVVPVEIMERKIRAGSAARISSEPIIIARSDSYALEGLDSAMRRMERYLKAGAEGVFITGLSTEKELRTVGAEFRDSIATVAMFEGGPTPWLPPRDLYEMGFRQVSYPAAIILRVVKAAEGVLRELAALASDGKPITPLPDHPATKAIFDEAVRLGEWSALDQRWR